MTWRPFATKPKRADTPEAAGLNEGAPRSYSTCSLQGCGSSRCKSGRGKLTICPRSHVRRSFEVTHGNESSNVKVLVGEGQATVRAAASSELHSLVRAAHVYRFKWDIADAEPLAFGRRLSRADVESSLGRLVCRGTEGGTNGRIRS